MSGLSKSEGGDHDSIEFKLLGVFIERRGRVLSRDQLLETAWDRGTHVADRAVDAHIVNLRRKIEPHPAEPKFLLSVRGLGYRFDGRSTFLTESHRVSRR